MDCLECKAQSACYRYKCCGLGFCSVSCYKNHSCTGPQQKKQMSTDYQPQSPSSLQQNASNLLTASQVEAMRADTKLRDMLSNKTLRKVLRKIAENENPVEVLSPYMQDEFFSEFVTRLLGTLSDVEETTGTDKQNN